MSPVFIESVGLAAPGLPTWKEGRAILRGEAAYLHAPLASPASAMLPANERRRATPAVRLAFQAAEDAMRGTTLPASGLATVFASSDADLAIIHSNDHPRCKIGDERLFRQERRSIGERLDE